jgi:hypothetical protein
VEAGEGGGGRGALAERGGLREGFRRVFEFFFSTLPRFFIFL